MHSLSTSNNSALFSHFSFACLTNTHQHTYYIHLYRIRKTRKKGQIDNMYEFLVKSNAPWCIMNVFPLVNQPRAEKNVMSKNLLSIQFAHTLKVEPFAISLASSNNYCIIKDTCKIKSHNELANSNGSINDKNKNAERKDKSHCFILSDSFVHSTNYS